MKPNAETLQKKDAQADRADDTMENLSFKLGEFLSTLLHDMWNAPRGSHATEQAKSSSSVAEEVSSDKVWSLLDSGNMVCEDDCEDIVFEKTSE